VTAVPEVPAGPPDPAAVRLLALADDPESVARWLSPRAAALVLLLRRDDARRLGTEALGPGLWRWASPGAVGWDLVGLPLDGPRGALPAALAGLCAALGGAATSTAIVLDAAPPPPLEVLAVVAAAAMTPGVDLSGPSWATAERAWLPGRRGIAVLRHGVDDERGSQELAAAVRNLGLLPEGSPSLDWVRLVEEQPSRGSRPRWDEVLRAGYLEAAVDLLLEAS
jgi:hypothetical protein